MNVTPSREHTDWAAHPSSYMVAWGLPTLVIVAGIFTDAQTRTILWTGAVGWKGIACLLNARRCGRTHCRYTGPFYLFLGVLVVLHGTGILPLGDSGWWVLGGTVLFGGLLVWWVSEFWKGKYS